MKYGKQGRHMKRRGLTLMLPILIYVISIPSFTNAQQKECFLLMVGKDASVDGKVLLAHNNDLSGIEASMLIKTALKDTSDYLPNEANSAYFHEMLILQTNLGFSEGDAVAINEYGVAIAGGLALKRDRNQTARVVDPLVKDGLGGGVRYYALQQSKTARECVELIGSLYLKYGIGYPSGVGIADTNEIWYMEAGGGSCWAAVRIPDECYLVAANGYRIGEIDFEDTLRYMTSPDLKNFCIENKLWSPSQKSFNFARIFGNGYEKNTGVSYYNSRRIWRCVDLLNPEKNYEPKQQEFPLYLKPSKKIDLETCFRILRDYYQNTPFDIFLPENRDKPERSIAVDRCVHTDVIALTPGLDVDFGAVLWTGLSTPFAANYIPVCYGIKGIPSAYFLGTKEYSPHSAFWQYKQLSDILISNTELLNRWNQKQQELETEYINNYQFLIKEAKSCGVNNPDRIQHLIDTFNNNHSEQALKHVSNFIREVQE